MARQILHLEGGTRTENGASLFVRSDRRRGYVVVDFGPSRVFLTQAESATLIGLLATAQAAASKR